MEKGDYKRMCELLEEREKVLKSSIEIIPKKLIEEILEKDKVRMEKIKENMKSFLESAKKSDVYKKTLASYQKAHDDMSKKSWGKG